MDEVERQVAERGEWGEWRGGQAKVDRGMADTDHRNFDGWGRQPHQVRPVWPLSSQVRCVHRGGRGADWQDAEWWRWRGGAGRNGPRHTTRRPSPEIRRGCCCCCRAGRLPHARSHALTHTLTPSLAPFSLPSLLSTPQRVSGLLTVRVANSYVGSSMCGQFDSGCCYRAGCLPPCARAHALTHTLTPSFTPFSFPSLLSTPQRVSGLLIVRVANS